MYEAKMKETDSSVIEFIEEIDHERKKREAFQLLDLFTETSAYEAKMWGPSIIGFGSYHYKYESGHEGDAPLVGFSPRKARISLYVMARDPEEDETLKKLGKYKAGKACVYVNKLADIDLDVLRTLIKQCMKDVKEQYPDQ